MPKTSRAKKWLKWLLCTTAVLILWLVFVGWSIWSFGSRDGARESDCAIVLGAAAYGSRPSPVFEGRLLHVITLYEEGTIGKIVVTGGFGDGAEKSESIVGKAYLVDAGIPKADILTESQSQTTRENLLQAKQLMDHNSLESAILVSDPLHMKRAMSMAERLGINAVPSPTPHTRFKSIGKRFEFLLREIYHYNHFLITGV